MNTMQSYLSLKVSTYEFMYMHGFSIDVKKYSRHQEYICIEQTRWRVGFTETLICLRGPLFEEQ